MDILLVGSQMETGGAQKVLFEQADYFYTEGHNVTVLFLYDKEGLHSKWKSQHKFHILNLSINKSNPFSILWGSIKLLLFLISNKIDVIESFTIHSNIFSIPLAWLTGVNTRIPTHHGFVNNVPNWLLQLHGLIINSSLTTKMVAVSREAANVAVSLEGARPEKIIMIPNGVNIPFQLDDEKIIRIRSEQSTWLPEQVILSVGRLVSQKGYPVLIEVANKILKLNKNIHFVILGDGPEKDNLIKFAEQLGVANNVHFLGIRDDVYEWMVEADVYLTTSNFEGLSIAMLEAMASGLPVIASDTSVPFGFISNLENGILVPKNDKLAYVVAILSIKNSPELGKMISNNANQNIVKNYSTQIMVTKYLDLFTQ